MRKIVRKYKGWKRREKEDLEGQKKDERNREGKGGIDKRKGWGERKWKRFISKTVVFLLISLQHIKPWR